MVSSDDIPGFFVGNNPRLTEAEFRYGNDDAPLMSRVPEPPPSHWGVTTSQARTLSPQYIEFLKRHREGKKDEREPERR
jgi:hypothetical protein